LLEALAMDFEMSGCRVLTAQNVERAFEFVRETRVDVVLTDQNMPGGTGMDLLGMVKQFNARIPVILMTAMAGMTRDYAQSRGAETVVTKPFDLTDLNRTIMSYKNSRPPELACTV
jgi:DNA-binding NtrC family response regulator